jgi:hypothetical protein
MPDGPRTYHGELLNVDWYVKARADVPWTLKDGIPWRPRGQGQLLKVGPVPLGASGTVTFERVRGGAEVEEEILLARSTEPVARPGARLRVGGSLHWPEDREASGHLGLERKAAEQPTAKTRPGTHTLVIGLACLVLGLLGLVAFGVEALPSSPSVSFDSMLTSVLLFGFLFAFFVPWPLHTLWKLATASSLDAAGMSLTVFGRDLKPGRGRFAGIVVFATFWLLSGFGLLAFLYGRLALLAIGGALLLFGLILSDRGLRHRRIGRLTVEIEPESAQPGETIRCVVRMEAAKAGDLVEAAVDLSAVEGVVSGWGTQVSRHRSIVFEERFPLSRVATAEDLDTATLEASIAVPPTAPASFDGNSNTLAWHLIVRLKAHGAPAWSKSCPIAVYP